MLINDYRLHIFQAVDCLHKSRVVHGDVEPRNVLLPPLSWWRRILSIKQKPVLIDFSHSITDHDCPGPGCKELVKVRKSLGLSDMVSQ